MVGVLNSRHIARAGGEPVPDFGTFLVQHIQAGATPDHAHTGPEPEARGEQG